MNQDEMDEQAYLSGSRAAWLSMLSECIRQLGSEGVEKAGWIAEREAAISQLRQVCAEHGDNDWDESLHLADIIDKHLGRYLQEQ